MALRFHKILTGEVQKTLPTLHVMAIDANPFKQKGKKMKLKIFTILFSLALVLQAVSAFGIQNSAQVLSAGGGAGAGDGKTSPHFGVIGEPLVSAPAAAGAYISSIGFIYQTFETVEPPPPPPVSIYAAMDMDINTPGDLEPDTLISHNAKEAWAAIALQSNVKFSGYEIELSFDPYKLAFVPEGETEFKYEDHPFTGAPNFLKQNNGRTTGLEVIDTGSGWLQIRNYLASPNCDKKAVDGAGFLAFLQFRHLIDDVEIPLVLENVTLTNCMGERLTVEDTADGTFVIEAFQPHFKIGGDVLDGDGHAIADVLIVLEDMNEIVVRETVSDEEGFYLFEELEAGTYFVIIDTAAYAFDPSWEEVSVDDDHQVIRVNFKETSNDLPGDLNGDGMVDDGDLKYIQKHIGDPVSEYPECDINQDDLINTRDLFEFNNLYLR